MMRRLSCLVMVTAFALAACEPEVGSDAWCKKMDDKPKGDWTANEAVDYTKYCIMELDKE